MCSRKLIWCSTDILNWHSTASLQNFSQTKISFLRALCPQGSCILLFHMLLTAALALEPLVLKLDFLIFFFQSTVILCLNDFMRDFSVDL